MDTRIAYRVDRRGLRTALDADSGRARRSHLRVNPCCTSRTWFRRPWRQAGRPSSVASAYPGPSASAKFPVRQDKDDPDAAVAVEVALDFDTQAVEDSPCHGTLPGGEHDQGFGECGRADDRTAGTGEDCGDLFGSGFVLNERDQRGGVGNGELPRKSGGRAVSRAGRRLRKPVARRGGGPRKWPRSTSAERRPRRG